MEEKLAMFQLTIRSNRGLFTSTLQPTFQTFYWFKSKPFILERIKTAFNDALKRAGK